MAKPPSPEFFGEKILRFYSDLECPESCRQEVELLLPFASREVSELNKRFYRKFYSDRNTRKFLIGINPGRLGGGVTGIPFTDPINLEKQLGINNRIQKKHELSSEFVYEVIRRMGGAKRFFAEFYLTAVSPVGFTRNGRNINYYDIKCIAVGWEAFFRDSLIQQLSA
jgi:hypothetical protein